jgi:hypothetical protein
MQPWPTIHLGEATGKGFYNYEAKRKGTPDPEIMKYIQKSRSMTGVTLYPEVWIHLFVFYLYILYFLRESLVVSINHVLQWNSCALRFTVGTFIYGTILQNS